MAEAISHWPLTMKTLVQFQASLCGICGGKSGIGSVYFRVLQLYSVYIILPLLHTHSSVTDYNLTNWQHVSVTHFKKCNNLFTCFKALASTSFTVEEPLISA